MIIDSDKTHAEIGKHVSAYVEYHRKMSCDWINYSIELLMAPFDLLFYVYSNIYNDRYYFIWIIYFGYELVECESFHWLLWMWHLIIALWFMQNILKKNIMHY